MKIESVIYQESFTQETPVRILMPRDDGSWCSIGQESGDLIMLPGQILKIIRIAEDGKEPAGIETHPIQGHYTIVRCPAAVTKAAYEVYEAVCGEQKALITGECRGGFSPGELIAFLYARSFPQKEWRNKFDEAMEGMEQRHCRIQ